VYIERKYQFREEIAVSLTLCVRDVTVENRHDYIKNPLNIGQIWH